MMAMSGLVIIGVGLFVSRVAGELVRGEISRKNYNGRGFKIKEAFASDEAWYRINREGGKRMILSSKLLVVIGVLMALFGVLMAICDFPRLFSILIFNAAFVAVILVMLVPSCWYVIQVKRDERKRRAT